MLAPSLSARPRAAQTAARGYDAAMATPRRIERVVLCGAGAPTPVNEALGRAIAALEALARRT